MSFNSLFRRYYACAVLGALAVATPFALSAVPTASAQPMTSEPTAVAQTKSTISELPSQERAALVRGEVLVSGENGEFLGRVLVDSSMEEAWAVLTDYDNFENFLPNIKSSELLEKADNRKVFEQVNEFKVLPFVTTRSRVKIQATESYPQRVDFTLVDGDLKSLKGVWLLEPVSNGRVLVTHQVSVDPGDASPRGIFYSTYKSMLEDSLAAAKQEAESRMAAM